MLKMKNDGAARFVHEIAYMIILEDMGVFFLFCVKLQMGDSKIY